MSETEIRARVTAFVSDFHREWQRCGRGPASHAPEAVMAAFDTWREALESLATTHLTAGAAPLADTALSSNPSHAPTEEIRSVVLAGSGTATVDTIMSDGPVPSYFRYLLHREADAWRISRVEHHFHPPGDRLVDEDEGVRLLAMASEDAPLGPATDDPRLDFGALFAAGREVSLSGEPATIAVTPLGTLSTSGALSIRDMGYGDFDLDPLPRRVPSGTYPIEVAHLADVSVNVALRMLVSDIQVSTWHRAGVVGVDAGNVGIVDLAGLVACEAQQVERIFQDYAVTLGAGHGSAVALDPDGPISLVMVESGYGDGAYPIWWGCGADGAIAHLLVDFLVLAEHDEESVEIPWRTGHVRGPGLDDLDLDITESGAPFGLGKRSFTLSHRGNDVRGWRVVAPGGAAIVDSSSLGSHHGDGRVSYAWTGARPPRDATIEIVIDRGMRHI